MRHGATVHGWLFDAYPNDAGIVLWMLDDDGHPHQLQYPYHPALFIAGDRQAVATAERALVRSLIRAKLTPTVQRELMSVDEIPVVRVAIHNPLVFPTAMRLLTKVPGLTLYNCDIAVAHLFFYDTGLFPLARCAVEHVNGDVQTITATTSPEDLEYTLPPLVTLRVRLERPATDPFGSNPTHGRRGLLEASIEGETVVLCGDDPVDLVTSINRLLKRYDPDVILTEWGDSFLLPHLRTLAARAGIPLALNRDPRAGIRTRRARSYVTYGQVVYQAGAQMFHGRWHIDLRNSFIFGESEMAGLLEIARLARLPVQYLARTTTGTAISSMQLAQAIRDGILIPWKKSEPEAFKTASQLIVSDKGGLTYQPLVGLFEEVGELDFSSMYPTIMSTFNVSPETVECTCCPNSRIPEINYTICTRRRGLVPRVLDHLLERRNHYKRRKRETTGSTRALYDQRQTALKWCLVTCLDGETLVPFKSGGQSRVAPIREVVDAFLQKSPGVLSVHGLYVFGYDKRLRPIENPVRKVIKAPAPKKLLRVRLQSGRELRMIPDHRCFVLEGNRLLVKRAAELRVGDLVPVASYLPFTAKSARTINLITELLRQLSTEEQQLWRVFGKTLKGKIAEAYWTIREIAKADYTDKTIWNWREYGYLPLRYVPLLRLGDEDFAALTIGRGKREGGIIQRAPALLSIDQDLGFLLGFFIGDGNGRRTFLRFSVGQNEPDVARKLREILVRKFHLRSSRRKERKAKMYVLQVNSVALARIFEVVLKVGNNAHNGKLDVPPLVWDGGDDLVYGFLSGLIASDGCVGEKRTFLRITSARKPFIDRLGMLLIMRGIPHRYCLHGRLYSLEIVGKGITSLQTNGWFSRKHQRTLERRLRGLSWKQRLTQFPRVVGPLQFMKIRSIETVHSTSPFVYCFEVEKDFHGFVVSGGIFTANSFGFLGYRNARFGRIEAHEAVTAYAREMLLRAKEVAETHGFRMLHALVDSMWLHKPGATRKDYEALAEAVTDATALPIFVEGVYRWIAFLPSKTHRGVGVPNRYLGVFDDNTTKVRGIEVRRSDVPILVEQMQERMLQCMFRCATLAEVHAAIPEILVILEEALVRLRAGDVTAPELVVTNSLSQEVQEYVHNTVQAISARTLDRNGVHVHPGEAVQFIITDRQAKVPEDRVRPYALLGTDWSYDAEAYAEMLVRAAETVLELFGFLRDRLRREVWARVRASSA